MSKKEKASQMTEQETVTAETQVASDHNNDETASDKTADSNPELSTEAVLNLAEELQNAREEIASLKDRYLRTVAEMENFRRRLAREKQEIIRSAAAGMIESLLPVLDNLRLGLQSAENHPEAREVTKGFAMVHEQLNGVLREQGLEMIEPQDVDFDPNLHDALTQQPSAVVEEGKVLQTVRIGYRLNERLLRAASVIVSSGPGQNNTNANG
jgi:molecular chaperone GrpE